MTTPQLSPAWCRISTQTSRYPTPYSGLPGLFQEDGLAAKTNDCIYVQWCVFSLGRFLRVLSCRSSAASLLILRRVSLASPLPKFSGLIMNPLSGGVAPQRWGIQQPGKVVGVRKAIRTSATFATLPARRPALTAGSHTSASERVARAKGEEKNWRCLCRRRRHRRFLDEPLSTELSRGRALATQPRTRRRSAQKHPISFSPPTQSAIRHGIGPPSSDQRQAIGLYLGPIADATDNATPGAQSTTPSSKSQALYLHNPTASPHKSNHATGRQHAVPGFPEPSTTPHQEETLQARKRQPAPRRPSEPDVP